MSLSLFQTPISDFRQEAMDRVEKLLESERLFHKGPVTWDSEIGQRIQQFRDSQYQISAPYLQNEFQNSLEARLALDDRSFHFAAIRENEIQGCLRLTPQAFEMSELSPELHQVSQNFSGYLEISRLITTKTLRKQLIGEKLLLSTGLWVRKNTQYKGFIAICRGFRRRSFERYGLIPFNDQTFNIPSRGNDSYFLLWANFDMILKAALKITS